MTPAPHPPRFARGGGIAALVDRPTTGLSRVAVSAIAAARAIGEIRELLAVVRIIAIDAVAKPSVHAWIESLEGFMKHSTHTHAQGDVHHIVIEAPAIGETG